MNTCKLLVCGAESPVVSTGVRIFQEALSEKNLRFEQIRFVPASISGESLIIVIGTADEYTVKVLLEGNGRQIPLQPESTACLWLNTRGGKVLLLSGSDERGLLYTLLETARRVRTYGGCAVEEAKEYTESPDNQVRCMDRYLLGHLDNEWFLSEAFWEYYCERLANARFNRFCLILGFDTAYMSPPYPFFVEVPGYESVGLTERVTTSREDNLNALRMIVNTCHRYGIRFVLATWQQRPWTTIQESLVRNLPESETALRDYCHDGIVALLRAVPEIDIVQFRVNHESGVGTQVSAEDFWNSCQDAVAEAGRQLGKRFTLDLRAKGLTESMVEHGQSLGLDIEVPTKYWCEHAALPYHLSVMRSEELAKLDNFNHSRRYSYADMLRKPKKYDVIYRLWNYGSTNLFLWGEADYVRRFSRSCSLSGSAGYQVNAPLSLKYGHELSHIAPWRIFNDPELNRDTWEEERFWLWYTLYGRIGYNIHADLEIWESEFEKRFGKEPGVRIEQALALSSRIMPLITTVHMPVHPSLRYWTELNTGWALFPENNVYPMESFDFYDQISYGSTEPSDHGLFYGIDEYAHDVCTAHRAQGKYTPQQYASWLEQLGTEVLRRVEAIREDSLSAEAKAACIDMTMTARLALYHAHKIRSAYALACWRETGEKSYLPVCRDAFRAAMAEWKELSALGSEAYYHDLDFSSAGTLTRRGTWADLTVELERDWASIDAILAEQGAAEESAPAPLPEQAPAVITADFPKQAKAGRPLVITAAAAGLLQPETPPVLHYRDVNQMAGMFRTLTMEKQGDGYAAVIPAEEITAEFDLMAYITVQAVGSGCTLFPGVWHPCYPYPYAVIETTV